MSLPNNLIRSEWVVFLDGVQIPHLGLSITTPLDSPSRAAIYVVPARELQNARPDSLVHLFRRDSYPLARPAAVEEFKLAWEGTLDGIGAQKSRTSRHVTLSAVSLMGTLQKSRAFSSGVGAIPNTPVLTGGTFLGLGQNQAALVDSVFSWTTLFADFGEDTDEPEVPLRSSGPANFGLRLIRLLSTLCVYNAGVRMQVTRYRLLDKVAAFSDDTLQSLLNIRFLQSLTGQMQSRITENSTLLDMLEHVLSFGFYHHTTVLFPRTPDPGPVGYVHTSSVAGRYIPSQSLRNDIAFLPETYATLPPPCNIVFPDQIDTYSYQRTFSGESTRHIIIDPFANIYFMAPSRIGSFGLTTGGAGVGVSGGGSPYGSTVDGSPRNYLDTFTERELEKGVVASVSSSDYEAFAAFGIQGKTPSANDQAKQLDTLESIESAKSSDYAETMSGMADFVLTLKKYQRAGSLTLRGSHFMVPGFPTIVLDESVPFLAQVAGLEITVDPTGNETTVVSLDKVRPVPAMGLDELQRRLVQLVADNTETVNAATAAASEVTLETLDIADPAGTSTGVSALVVTKKFMETAVAANADSVVGAIDRSIPPASTVRLIRALSDAVSVSQDFLVTSRATLASAQDLSALSEFDLTVWSDAVRDLGYLLGEGPVSGPPHPALYGAVYLLNPRTGDAFLELFGNPDTGNRKLEFPSLTADIQAAGGIGTSPFFFRGPGSGMHYAGTLVGRIFVYQAVVRYAESVHRALTVVVAITRSISEHKTDKSGSAEALAAAQAVATQDQVDQVIAAIQRLSDDLDIPVPPPGFSAAHADLGALDAQHQELLGTQPFYQALQDVDPATYRAVQTLDQLAPDGLSAALRTKVNALKARVLSYSAFYDGLKAISRLYTLFPDQTDPGEWQQRREDGDDTARWAHQTYHQREGTSLRQFLDDNRLGLATVQSDVDTSASFWHMFVPEELTETIQASDGTELTWDDSLFSKIVDDAGLFNQVDGQDEYVAAARKSRPPAMLTTKERQAQWLAYAKAVTGSAAFTGN